MCLCYSEGESRRLPSVCKKALFEEYKALSGQTIANDIYFTTKQLSHLYQQAKAEFWRCMAMRGYGEWVKKPTEVDYFE